MYEIVWIFVRKFINHGGGSFKAFWITCDQNWCQWKIDATCLKVKCLLTRWLRVSTSPSSFMGLLSAVSYLLQIYSQIINQIYKNLYLSQSQVENYEISTLMLENNRIILSSNIITSLIFVFHVHMRSCCVSVWYTYNKMNNSRKSETRVKKRKMHEKLRENREL